MSDHDPLFSIPPDNLDEAAIRQFVTNTLGKEAAEEFLARMIAQFSGAETWSSLTEFREAETRSFFRLARKPNVLKALISIYTNTAEVNLPRNNGRLMQMLTTVLWEQQREQPGWMPYQDMAKEFAQVAFEIIDEGRIDAVPYHSYLLHSEIMYIAAHANLLEHLEALVHIYHPAILNYFAALQLKEIGVSSRLEEPQFEEPKIHCHHRIVGRWDDAIVALCGLSDAEAVVTDVANINPYLAAVCIGSGISVSNALSQSVVDCLVGLLGEEIAYTRIAAARALGQMGEPAIPSLLDTLRNNTDPYARTGAAIALQIIAPPSAVPDLADRLWDMDVTWYFGVMTCDFAAGALKAIGTPEALEAVARWQAGKNQHHV
jgi:hypothetical protein